MCIKNLICIKLETRGYLPPGYCIWRPHSHLFGQNNIQFLIIIYIVYILKLYCLRNKKLIQKKIDTELASISLHKNRNLQRFGPATGGVCLPKNWLKLARGQLAWSKFTQKTDFSLKFGLDFVEWIEKKIY